VKKVREDNLLKKKTDATSTKVNLTLSVKKNVLTTAMLVFKENIQTFNKNIEESANQSAFILYISQ